MASAGFYGGFAALGDEIRNISKERTDRRYEVEQKQAERTWQEYRDRVNDMRYQNLLRLKSELSARNRRQEISQQREGEMERFEAKERIKAKYRDPGTPTLLREEPGGPLYKLQGLSADVITRRRTETDKPGLLEEARRRGDQQEMPERVPFRGQEIGKGVGTLSLPQYARIAMELAKAEAKRQEWAPRGQRESVDAIYNRFLQQIQSVSAPAGVAPQQGKDYSNLWK